MSDNKKNTDGHDRSKVAGEEDYELSYLEEKLGVSRQKVKEAVKAVGNKRKDVEAYLGKNKK